MTSIWYLLFRNHTLNSWTRHDSVLCWPLFTSASVSVIFFNKWSTCGDFHIHVHSSAKCFTQHSESIRRTCERLVKLPNIKGESRRVNFIYIAQFRKSQFASRGFKEAVRLFQSFRAQMANAQSPLNYNLVLRTTWLWWEDLRDFIL